MISLRKTGTLINDDSTLEGVELNYRKEDGTLFIWFEGTNHDKDWAYSFDLTIKKRYHAGYYKAYKRIETKFLNLIASVQPSKIYISGHSLGAGIARIAVCELFLKDFFNLELVTYGAPRSCTLFQRRILKKINVTNYLHKGDLIRLLPPFIPVFWFFHTHNKKKIGKFNFKFYDNHQIQAYILATGENY